MWLGWNDDCAFSINSQALSYLDTKENHPNTCLSMLHNMKHSHYHGYTPKESYWFADTVIHDRQVPQVNAVYTDNTVSYSCSVPPKSVRLYYITDKLSYTRQNKHGIENVFMTQNWQILELNPSSASAPLPENTVGRYLEFTLENGIVLTTPYYE